MEEAGEGGGEVEGERDAEGQQKLIFFIVGRKVSLTVTLCFGEDEKGRGACFDGEIGHQAARYYPAVDGHRRGVRLAVLSVSVPPRNPLHLVDGAVKRRGEESWLGLVSVVVSVGVGGVGKVGKGEGAEVTEEEMSGTGGMDEAEDGEERHESGELVQDDKRGGETRSLCARQARVSAQHHPSKPSFSSFSGRPQPSCAPAQLLLPTHSSYPPHPAASHS